jgi:hypothetical protein
MPIGAIGGCLPCEFGLAFCYFSLLFGGCGSQTLLTATGTSVPRSYNGTASVGDFLSITLDPAAQTLLYTNLSNGDSGTVPYTVNADGTYTLNDPHGNLVAAYEVRIMR